MFICHCSTVCCVNSTCCTQVAGSFPMFSKVTVLQVHTSLVLQECVGLWGSIRDMHCLCHRLACAKHHENNKSRITPTPRGMAQRSEERGQQNSTAGHTTL